MTFLEWLDAELTAREWSEGKLAQRAAISRSLISHVRHGRRAPSADFCIAIAKPLQADPVAVLRLAGVLPKAQGDTDDPAVAEMWSLCQRIPEHKRAVVIEALRAWASVE